MSATQIRIARPPVFAALAAVAQLIITRKRKPTAGSAFAAATITAGSGVLALTSVMTLRENGTTVDATRPRRTKKLVTDGPFACTRNPIYLALTGLLIAHAVHRRSMAALVPAAGFAAAVDRVQIAEEEQALARRFGKRYDRYRRSVPRWIGAPDR